MGIGGKEDEETREDREVEDEEEKDRGKSKTRIYPRRDMREDREKEMTRREGGREMRDRKRRASPGMPFRVSRQVAISPKRRPSEPASQPESNEITRIYIL